MQALCSTWPRDVLTKRNAHLAFELVQRAISKRNGRLSLSRLLASPLTLSQLDFGLDGAQVRNVLDAVYRTQAASARPRP